MTARKRKATRVADLQPAGYNPRRISGEQLDRLAASMEQFGDLGGVVFNRRTGNLIGGHQRHKHLPADAPIVITERYRKANAQGTVAVGYIEHAGERWSYREVDVDLTTETAMNIAANKHGGEWDMPMLAELLEGLDEQDYDMAVVGFAPQELEDVLNWDPDDHPSGEGGGGGGEGGGEPPADRYQEQYGVIVVCEDEATQEQAYNELLEQGYNCKVVVT